MKASLSGPWCLHLIPPLIKLRTAVPLLPSFLWANLNLSIRSLEQLCVSTDLQCFSATTPLYPDFSFNRKKADFFVGKVSEIFLGRLCQISYYAQISSKLPLFFFRSHFQPQKTNKKKPWCPRSGHSGLCCTWTWGTEGWSVLVLWTGPRCVQPNTSNCACLSFYCLIESSKFIPTPAHKQHTRTRTHAHHTHGHHLLWFFCVQGTRQGDCYYSVNAGRLLHLYIILETYLREGEQTHTFYQYHGTYGPHKLGSAQGFSQLKGRFCHCGGSVSGFLPL